MIVNELKNNKLLTRFDFEDALLNIFHATKPFFSKEKAFLILPNHVATDYEDSTIYLESFARLLWGIAPYFKESKDIEVIEFFKTGILNGTTPGHMEYWGDLRDYDQRAVEMTPIALFLFFSKIFFWDKLTEKNKKNIEQWLLQINNIKLHKNNWLFFRVLVNVFLKKIGAKYNENIIHRDLLKIEEFYLGDGWYADGNTNKIDYYISWGFHFYSLIYARIMENDDVERSRLYKKRAKIFAEDFIYWFSEDGSTIPFGRSLTYRFAQVAFWSAVIFAGVDVFSLGIIKGIISRNLRWWYQKPIFNSSKLLTIGYTYTNLIMSESYNGPGSPYWALKAFLILGIEETHKFWKVKEEKFPKLNSKVFQKNARITICRKTQHVAAFINGQDFGKRAHEISKYEKYVYSNIYGFSVPRSESGVLEGVYDSTIIVSEDGEKYKPKSSLTEFYNNENFLYSRWNPWSNVEIESYILPGLPWHARVHKIKTKREIILQETGFSIERQSHLQPPIKRSIIENSNGIGISYGEKHIGIISLLGNGLPSIIYPVPNTNILYPRSELPILIWRFIEGDFIIISGILGDIDLKRNNSNFWNDKPEFKIYDRKINIFIDYDEKIEINIDLEREYRIPSKLNNKINSFKIYLKKVYKNIKETY